MCCYRSPGSAHSTNKCSSFFSLHTSSESNAINFTLLGISAEIQSSKKYSLHSYSLHCFDFYIEKNIICSNRVVGKWWMPFYFLFLVVHLMLRCMVSFCFTIFCFRFVNPNCSYIDRSIKHCAPKINRISVLHNNIYILCILFVIRANGIDVSSQRISRTVVVPEQKWICFVFVYFPVLINVSVIFSTMCFLYVPYLRWTCWTINLNKQTKTTHVYVCVMSHEECIWHNECYFCFVFS